MVGADPVRFKALAEETALPRNLRRRCGWDYDRASRSWETSADAAPPRNRSTESSIEVTYGR